MALDGLKRIDRTTAGACIRETAGQKGHFLCNLDLRFLVVQRDDRRHRDDVGIAVTGQCAQDGGEIRARVLVAATADRQPAGRRFHGRGIVDARGDVSQADAADRLIEEPDQEVVGGSVDDPVHAKIAGRVRRHLDQHRLDDHLRAPDIEPVDDRHQCFHRLWRRRDNQCIGLRLGPDGHRAVATGGRGLPGLRGAASKCLLLQLGRELFRIGIAQIADLGVAAGFERGIEMRDQRAEAQSLRSLTAKQHAVGAFVGDHARATCTFHSLGRVQRVHDAHDFAR